MRNIIGFDLNNVAMRMLFCKEVGGRVGEPDYALWHFMMWSSIDRFVRALTNVDVVILAADSSPSWRKLVYSQYKADRKDKKQKWKFDKSVFYKEYDLFIKRAQKYLPFYTLRQKYAEGDDILASLAMAFTSHNTDINFIIVSVDEDFDQIICGASAEHGSINVYDPIKKTYRTCADPEMFLKERFLTGQKKDNIFNILSPTGIKIGGLLKKKPGFGESAAKKALSAPEGLQAYMDKRAAAKVALDKNTGFLKPNWFRGWKHRYDRNRLLIDFRMIPAPIKNAIVRMYNEYKIPEFDNLEGYFQEYNWPNVIPQFKNIQQDYKPLYRR